MTPLFKLVLVLFFAILSVVCFNTVPLLAILFAGIAAVVLSLLAAEFVNIMSERSDGDNE